MSILPEPVAVLIAALGRLPGIGPRSAERLALHLVQSDSVSIECLAESLLDAKKRIGFCKICGALTEQQPCVICSGNSRNRSLICVVETAVDVINIEKSGAFSGLFHVLGGKISPLNGVGPEDLRISELESRLYEVEEIILALGTDVEGDATSNYLAQRLSVKDLVVTRIAHGIPAGTGLEFADDLTLSKALEGRREIK